MPDLTRRGFLTRASLSLGAVGVGIAGGTGLRQVLTQSAQPSAPLQLPDLMSLSLPLPSISLPGGPATESMIVHIRDVGKAEIALMVGTREVIFSDPQIVQRLVQAAGGRVEG